MEAAAKQGAEMVVFPEAYVPGYPTWIGRLRPGGDMALSGELHARLLESAVDIARGDLAPVLHAAKKHAISLGLGMHEREGELSRSRLFNTYVLIGADGTLLNHYRKMVPTNPERMIWGRGDASGSRVVDTPVGRVGALICCGNFMPLSRYALYSQGIEVHLAPTWDSGEGWIGSMQHIAREGRCWVVSSATALEVRDLAADLPGRDTLFSEPDEWLNPGDAVVIAPGGKIVAGPHHRDKTLLFADIDPKAVAIARRSLDVAGHYSRPDIFDLQVNRKRLAPIAFDDE